MEQKDPSKTIGYILVLLFIPVFGLIVYQLFGQNLRKEKLFNRKAFTENIQLNQIITQSNFEFHRNFEDLNLHLAHGKKLANLLRNNDRAFLTKHNQVKLLVNGENAFPEMLNAIKNAKHFIHLEYYRIANDFTGNLFFDALAEKAE